VRRETINRRQFLIGSLSALGTATLLWTQRLFNTLPLHAQEPQPTSVLYFPIVSTPPLPHVVHVRSSNATSWNGTGYFYNAVNQNAVDAMIQTGLKRLTGATSWADIWGVLFGTVRVGGYAPGQKIAFKVNLNNNRTSDTSCDTHGNVIDALPQPLLGAIRGMVAAGVQPSDIVIYDSIRDVPSYLRNPILAAYPGVQFVGTGNCPGVTGPAHGKDPSLAVQFHDPNHYLQARSLANVLYDATYVVNVPILKRHSGDGAIPVSLGFKNHFGSLDRISGNGNDDLHLYVSTTGSQYSAAYNPLPDIYLNDNIRKKTALTLGDGLFGAFGVGNDAAMSWSVFGGPANSLFFSADPVAIDCVMVDFIVAQGLVTKAHAYDYLFYASQVGLGLCEGTHASPGGNPLQLPYGSGYTTIRYARVDV
jgi:uncharacterized protein (DUF362 family)